MGKRIWIVGLLAAVVLIAGCSTSESGTQAAAPAATTPTDVSATADASATATTASETPKPLEVVESGYTVVRGSYVEYAFVLRNPNPGFGVQFPVVRLTMRDAAGTVFNTTDVVFRRWLLPGETATWADEADMKGRRFAKVNFEAVDPGTKWKNATEARSMGLATPLKTTHLKTTKTASGLTFTVEVENPGTVAVDDPVVSIVLRDKSGRIVAGYSDLGEELVGWLEAGVHVEVGSRRSQVHDRRGLRAALG